MRFLIFLGPQCSFLNMQSPSLMHLKDAWNLLLVGDRGVGKTAFAHQVRPT